MGKKSKNPRKADKSSKDRNPFFRAVDEILANSMPREGLPPPSAPCLHMKAEAANMERLEQLRNELKEYQGGRCLGDDNMGGADKVIFWSIKSRIRDGYYRNMLDLVVATATDNLLQYDCSSTNYKTHTLMQDLILVACALDEADEGYGIMEEGKQYKNAWAKIPDLVNRGFEKGSVHGKTELSMVRFIYKKAPCRCLKTLKSKLKETYGPQFETCKNNQCQKVAEFDECFQCSSCLRAYCSEACRKTDWDNGKHGGFCKPRSGKKAVERFDKLAEIFPDVPFESASEYLEQLGEEEMNKLIQVLDDSTKGEVSEVAQMLHQNMSLDDG